MIDAAHQQADQGVTDRLLSSAMRLVKIRPVGEAPGDTPEAIVARMEERVKNGNLAAAVSEWNALPEASKRLRRTTRRRWMHVSTSMGLPAEH